MRLLIKCLIIAVVLLAVVVVGGVAGLLIFGTTKAPEPLGSVTKPFATMDYGGLPPVERYTARDGAALAYRTYTAGDKAVVVLIHGSAGSSADMHVMAKAMQAKGMTVYVPDLRGHGDNHPHGDINYLGQLDDDMADFMRVIQPHHQGAQWTLIGFSSGAVLRSGLPPSRSDNRLTVISYLVISFSEVRCANCAY